ncbi:eIF-2-alpha kinase GCN2-like [Contarinia nasturtii]|uniref:eIF-2-alpha kinase GCN2-like n=1 Tax=Contarinia nasturtii TaxID=265458 RepID=UPI0012D4486D|nr:eIF-2-alpha kinase GCN2-like [Contarinia nasturtii]
MILLRSTYEDLPSFYLCKPMENQRKNEFNGFDENEVPLHITLWKINITKYNTNPGAIAELENTIKDYVLHLKKLNHPHIVSFESVIFDMIDGYLDVYLARKSINGISFKVMQKFGWPNQNVTQLARTLLQALFYLHSNDFIHGNINETSIFIDENGKWKVADFCITPYLNHLTAHEETDYIEPNKMSDCIQMGELIESLGATTFDADDFVRHCKSNASMQDLFERPLIKSTSKFINSFIDVIKLGSGTFGEVLHVFETNVERHSAIKRIKICDKSSADGRFTFEEALREAKTHSMLSHKNIVQFFTNWKETMNESDTSPIEYMEVDDLESPCRHPVYRKCEKKIQVMYIQMELCHQDLRKAINEGLSNDMTRIGRYLFGITDGLKYIHSKKLIHHDLKPENIFLTKDDVIKIGDFGLATPRLSRSTERCGTPIYMAPEIGVMPLRPRADMYSLGIILFEMCYAMQTYNRLATLNKIREKGAPIEAFINISSEFYEVIKNLLNHEVEKRYMAIKILEKFPHYRR